MSRVTELANNEADAVEAEDENLEPVEAITPEHEPDPEPVAEQPLDEAAIRKAERAISEQKARLAKIIGDAMVAHDCPLCQALGYLPELPPPGAMLEVVATEDGVSFEIRAPGVPPELLDARDKEACDWCDGYGQVRTFSKNPNAAIAQCSKCNGNGWVQKAADAPGPNIPPLVTGTLATVVNGQQGAVPDDAWGRPYGHQHYGIPPSAIGTVGV